MGKHNKIFQMINSANGPTCLKMTYCDRTIVLKLAQAFFVFRGTAPSSEVEPQLKKRVDREIYSHAKHSSHIKRAEHSSYVHQGHDHELRLV